MLVLAQISCQNSRSTRIFSLIAFSKSVLFTIYIKPKKATVWGSFFKGTSPLEIKRLQKMEKVFASSSQEKFNPQFSDLDRFIINHRRTVYFPYFKSKKCSIPHQTFCLNIEPKKSQQILVIDCHIFNFSTEVFEINCFEK